jgi:indolepyruvate ferredoxin oxidoreductase beta subunit
MSQRGGSVSTHVRYGSRVESPVIELGGADLLVGFELMEALRWLEYLKPGGTVIVNDYKINPIPVQIGQAVYPQSIADELRKHTHCIFIKAFDEALLLGDSRAMNTLLLGAAVEVIGIKGVDWDRIIESCVRPAFASLNKQAFNKGRALGVPIPSEA